MLIQDDQYLFRNKMGQKSYLKFNNPRPNSLLPKDGTIKSYLKRIAERILLLILPNANPDFDRLLDEVESWEIEYDLEENCVQREIGFNKNSQAILATPLNSNYGFWADNKFTLEGFNKFDPIEIPAVEFENNWQRFLAQFAVLNKST